MDNQERKNAAASLNSRNAWSYYNKEEPILPVKNR
jgi:hypothetical protein